MRKARTQTDPKKKAQDTTKTKKPVRIDSTVKTKWKSPEITHWNKVAAKRDSIANSRLAKRDSIAKSRRK